MQLALEDSTNEKRHKGDLIVNVPMQIKDQEIRVLALHLRNRSTQDQNLSRDQVSQLSHLFLRGR